MMPGTNLFLKLSSVAVAHEDEYSSFSSFAQDIEMSHIVCGLASHSLKFLSAVNL